MRVGLPYIKAIVNLYIMYMRNQKVSKMGRGTSSYACVSGECWVWQKKYESRINAVEMKSFRSTAGVSLTEKLRNSTKRVRRCVEVYIVTKLEKAMIRWVGHVEKLNERRLRK